MTEGVLENWVNQIAMQIMPGILNAATPVGAFNNTVTSHHQAALVPTNVILSLWTNDMTRLCPTSLGPLRNTMEQLVGESWMKSLHRCTAFY